MPIPTALTWTLVTPPPASGGAQAPSTLVSGGGGGGGSTSSAVAAAPLLPCPIEAFTQQDLLDLFGRILPDHYLSPLKEVGPGYEILQAAAAMGARLSQAVERFACGAFILSATAGNKSVGSIEIYRPYPNAESISVIVKAGSVVQSSKGGRKYLTTTDVTFLATDLGPFTVPVIAVLNGYNYNEPGIVVAADGLALEGEIDTIVALVENPDVGDLTFRIRHPIATTGGVDASLDQHGADRLIFRGDGEADSQYRGRVRALPDNISPDAVDRMLQQILLPYGSSYNFIETFEIGYQTCWDGPSVEIAGSEYNPTTFVFDDNRPATPFRNRWMDENDMRGAFIVTTPIFGPVADYGMAFDDTALNASALVNPLGLRAVGAFDVPSTLAFGYLQGGFDGYDLPRATLMKTLYDTLQNIKAAGTSAVLELEGE